MARPAETWQELAGIVAILAVVLAFLVFVIGLTMTLSRSDLSPRNDTPSGLPALPLSQSERTDP